MAQKILFDADKRASEREDAVVKIGGSVFHPRKRSVGMMDEWLQASPESGLQQEEWEELAEKDRLLVFKSLISQLRVLLRDENGDAPDEDLLLNNLDVEDGFELLSLLTPDLVAEEDKAGNSDAADSETTT